MSQHLSDFADEDLLARADKCRMALAQADVVDDRDDLKARLNKALDEAVRNEAAMRTWRFFAIALLLILLGVLIAVSATRPAGIGLTASTGLGAMPFVSGRRRWLWFTGASLWFVARATRSCGVQTGGSTCGAASRSRRA